eukprot:ANDGO_00384.mRNA.1 hypothetical protein
MRPSQNSVPWNTNSYQVFLLVVCSLSVFAMMTVVHILVQYDPMIPVRYVDYFSISYSEMCDLSFSKRHAGHTDRALSVLEAENTFSSFSTRRQLEAFSPDSCRSPSIMYITWDEGPFRGEQFFAQLHYITELAYLAKRSGRALIMPKVRIFPQNVSGIEWYMERGIVPLFAVPPLGLRIQELSDYFDYSELSEYIDVATLEQTMEANGNRMELVKSTAEQQRYVVDFAFSLRPMKLGLPEPNRTIDFNGNQFVVLDASFDVSGIREKISAACVLGLAFERGDFVQHSVNWNPWVRPEYFKILGKFKPVARFGKTADFFIRERFQDQSFLAVHWRRGDRSSDDPKDGLLRYHENSAEELVKFLDPILRKHSLKQVFLMTNSGNPRELVYLDSALPCNTVQFLIDRDCNSCAWFQSTPVAERWKHAQDEMFIQLMVSVRASVFVGHGIDYERTSGLTRYVLFLRRAAEFPDSTFYWRGVN